MVTSTLQAVVVVVVVLPLGFLLLGLMMAFATAHSSRPRLRAEWQAKVRQHGYRKALLRETLQDAFFFVLVVVALGLWQVLGKACGRS
jgi:hypothetical protein